MDLFNKDYFICTLTILFLIIYLFQNEKRIIFKSPYNVVKELDCK